MYDGPLHGVCPVCQVEREFAKTSSKEDLALIVEDVNELGQGNVIKGFFASILGDIVNLFRGGKCAPLYFCKTCLTRFYVCRNCMKPNRRYPGREQSCDHCHHPMIT
jgi:hypothetical protein